uniref:Retrotransposon Copia-like N-terminal domain-containing protein n=1 Tax=Nicotiana tabacum TaxID=4097 RepID=A0A1S4BE20_TOBAC|nr:PREDICTED: uncharacterized protein LOC107807306 [Nicotiana tabacum]
MANDEEIEHINVDSSKESNIDSNSPLYMHPSDNPGAIVVPVPFNGIGYKSWRRSVLQALSVKNKLGFINGDCKKPDLESPKYRLWERCDDMVTSWILNSLGKEIADSVEYVNDSVELWKELEDRYDQTIGANLYQVQKEINDLSQGTLDITGYYTMMKKLWEEFSTLSAKTQCSCNCTCGAKENMHKAEQDRRLIQFLMIFIEVYTMARGSILTINPLPSLAPAFSLLIQEEKQREIKPNNQLMIESVSLNVNTSKQPTFKTNYNPGNNYTSNSRPRPVCEHCRKPGHTKDKCYKLHGYPQGFQNSNQPFQNNNQRFQGANQIFQNPNQDFRFNRGKRTVANVHGPPTDMMTNNGDEGEHHNESQGMSFTKEQYGQLMSLLQHFKTSSGGEDPNSLNLSSGAANFAGIIVCTSLVDFGKLSCRCFKSKIDTWILDSGASNHMTFNRSSMCDITILPYPLLVVLPNGYKVRVIVVGSVKLAPRIVLHKVLFVPSFKYNLISIHLLTLHLRGIAFFTDGICMLQAPSLKRPLEIGRVKDGLYLLCSQCLKHKDASSSSITIKSFVPCLSVHPCDFQDAYFPSVRNLFLNKITSASSDTDVNVPSSVNKVRSCVSLNSHTSHENDILWNNRLRHVPFVKMKRITTFCVLNMPYGQTKLTTFSLKNQHFQ